MLPDEFDMHGEFGIGYGEILVIENEDIFGSEVNLASKLGEDLAQRGEILLTDRKSTRLNSSHSQISYAVFCLKKKKKKTRAVIIIITKRFHKILLADIVVVYHPIV